MNYEFIQNIPGLLFTSAIPDVVFSCDKSAICSIADDTSRIIFTTKYYPTPENIITVHNIRDIVETYLYNSGLVTCTFTVKFDAGDNEDYSSTFIAIYCDMDIEVEADPYVYNSFLTTLNSKCTCPGFCETLTVITDSEETVSIKGIDNNGSDFIIDLCDLTANAISAYVIDISYDTVLSQLKDKTPEITGIKAYTVICGNRYFSFYIDKSLEYSLCFNFRNCFNAREFFICSGSIKKINTVNAEDAVSNNIISQYNISSSCSYETETSILMNDVAEWIPQFLSSKKIKLCSTEHVYGNADIIISSSTFEPSTEDSKSAKFTWRFANNKIRNIYRDNTQRLGRFTTQYDFQYD